MVARRKHEPFLPTLVVIIRDKERKRRSSRAGSFISPASKEHSIFSLWFRTPPEDDQVSLQEWARFILSRKEMMSPEASPITPTSSTQNFSPRQRDTSDYFPRPGSGSNAITRGLHHKSSTATYSTSAKDRPITFGSHSPSLRSKRSDISSPSSNYPTQQAAYPIPGQHYTTVLPTDLPSPVNTTGEFQGEQVEGWTAAPRRGSAVSSPRRGHESISSNAQQPGAVDSSSPAGPRETILDRAFQMRYLQRGDRGAPGEDRLSSVARFDALMREADERRRGKEAAIKSEQSALRSAFEADDSSESDHANDDTDTDDGDFSDKQALSPPLIPPSAHRALQYLTGRPEPSHNGSPSRPGITRSPLSFHADSSTLNQEPPVRPHTAHGKSKSRRDMSHRAQSTQYLPTVPSAGMPTGSGKSEDDKTPRQSGTSTKRLSFTEFTRRLSSTSSLLLVQTNASGASSQRNSEIDHGASSTIPRTSLKPPGAGHPQDNQQMHLPEGREQARDRGRSRDQTSEEQNRACGWRGSVGVVSSEGGFF